VNNHETAAAHTTPRFSKETYIAIFALIGILIHLILRYVFHNPTNLALITVLVIGGIPLLFDLVRKIVAGEFGSDMLAGLSIVVSAILGQYLAGAIVVLMLSGGTALEDYATRRASAVLATLAGRMPQSAHRIVGVRMEDVLIPEVHVGDRLVVFPHEICPVDGVVAEGRGSMDESYLTGEPFHIAKVPGSAVLSGAVNGESAVTVTVTRLPVDSRYAKIMEVMQQAEANRPRFRRIGDRLGAWYTVLALLVAGAGWIIGHDPSRFLAVLVIATPCPLLLAIPVAIIGAISIAASRAIIVKDPAMLERIDSCRTVIFDKTEPSPTVNRASPKSSALRMSIAPPLCRWPPAWSNIPSILSPPASSTPPPAKTSPFARSPKSARSPAKD
jgi:cation transport ATPase